MAYTVHNFEQGDVLYAEQLNEMDAQIAANEMIGTPTDAQATAAINNWLDAHPEATTTVQDGAITLAKLNKNVLEKLPKRILYVSSFSESNDNIKLQNAINAALEFETCDLIIDETLNITETIQITFTSEKVQSLTIQGMFKNVRSIGNVFHGDANPTLRNNMTGCINCNVDGVVFNVLSRGDTPELCVRDCIFFNNSERSSDATNGWIWQNKTMTLFYDVGTVCNFVNNTAVGFDYFIYAPINRPDNGNANWTGDFGMIYKNTIYTCGHGIYIAYQDCTDIFGNAFTGMYGCLRYMEINIAHGITIRNNMFGPFMQSIPISMEAGVLLRACNASIFNNHGENSRANFMFQIEDSGTAVFSANQWTTTQRGRIIFVSGTGKVFLTGNSFDTTPLKGVSAKIYDIEEIEDYAKLSDLRYKYVATANDWDEYKETLNIIFNGLTTSIRPGYTNGFFESKFNSTGTLGTQKITWQDGKTSTRACWYGTFQPWYTET